MISVKEAEAIPLYKRNARRIHIISNKKYDASKFTKIPIFFKSPNRVVTLIEYKFYIIDNLSAKVLIIIDILKPK